MEIEPTSIDLLHCALFNIKTNTIGYQMLLYCSLVFNLPKEYCLLWFSEFGSIETVLNTFFRGLLTFLGADVLGMYVEKNTSCSFLQRAGDIACFKLKRWFRRER